MIIVMPSIDGTCRPNLQFISSTR